MTSYEEMVVALRQSHERLVAVVEPLQDMDVEQPAYPAKWSIADALSHLGSGAEITALILDRARAEDVEPAQADYAEIWDRWNAKSPQEQATDAMVADAALVEKFEQVSKANLPTLHAYGSKMTLEEFTAMRLDEHILHTWDVEAGLDSSATIDPARLPYMLERLETAAGRSAISQRQPWTVRIALRNPATRFRLRLGETTQLTHDKESSPPDAVLSAETFVRLIFGRVDTSEIAGHWDEQTEGFLDRLHLVFRGY